MLHVDPKRELVIVMLSAWDAATGTAEQHQDRRAFIGRVKQTIDNAAKKTAVSKRQKKH